MHSKIVWLADYTEPDIDSYTKILDLGLPVPYGFVIHRSYLHTVYANLSVQEKLLPLYEFTQVEGEVEMSHTHDLVDEIFRTIHIPREFIRSVSSHYEKILEKERQYLKLHVTDLNRAAHVLRHIYSPPVVQVSLLPYSTHRSLCAGDSSLLDTITHTIASHVKREIASRGVLDMRSILVQRVPNGQYSGYCETVNRTRDHAQQMVIYANTGAQILDEAGDIYIMQKDNMSITDHHIMTQPHKMVLKGPHYRKLKLHSEEGSRQILPDSLITKIGYLARDIERQLYFPQKMYWTIENGILFVTRLKQI